MNENTDKELLELAAKAIGLPIEYRGFGNGSSQLARVVGYNKENGITAYKPWNPLEPNSGDALQLAGKLNLIIECMKGQSAARTFDSKFAGCVDIADYRQYPNRDFNPDPEVATCRAIVLVAAEIGKQL